MAYGAKYYQMRAVRSGRFRGDPGLIGNIVKGIGRVVGTVAKTALAVAPVLPGIGPVARVAGRVLGIGTKVAGAAGAVKLAQGVLGTKPPGIAMQLGGGLQPLGYGGMAGVRSGSSSTAPVPPGYNPVTGMRRKYRRMNVTNMRALTRSIRRVKRFEKIARSCVTLASRVRVKKGARGRKC